MNQAIDYFNLSVDISSNRQTQNRSRLSGNLQDDLELLQTHSNQQPSLEDLLRVYQNHFEGSMATYVQNPDTATANTTAAYIGRTQAEIQFLKEQIANNSSK